MQLKIFIQLKMTAENNQPKFISESTQQIIDYSTLFVVKSEFTSLC